MPNKKVLLIIFLIYTALSLIITFPIVLYINGRVLGAPHSDIHTHLWDFWRVKSTLLEDKAFPLRTDLINFPKGGVLFPASLLNAVVSVPIQLLWGIEAAVNIIVIFNLALAGLGAFCLAYYLLKDVRSSFIAGLIYGFCPFLLSYGIASGGLEIISIGWLPLFFLYFIRSIREKGFKNPILASIFSFFIITSCLYYTILAIFFVVIFSIYFLIMVKDRERDLILYFSKTEESEQKKIDRGLVIRIAALLLVALILTLPVVISVYNSIKGPDSILPHEEFKRRMEKRILSDPSSKMLVPFTNITFLEDYLLRIGKDKLVILHEVTDFYRSSYCGYAVVFLAILALIFLRKKFTYFWGTATLFFMALSLGPYLAIFRKYFEGAPISPIWVIIYYLIPQFKLAYIHNHFVLLVMLCLSLLAAGGSKIIINRLGKPYRLFFPIGIGSLILFEFLFISPIQFPIPETALEIPRFYKELAKEEGEFGILELPFFIYGRYMFPRERFSYQVTHGKPITDIVAGFLPRYIVSNSFTKKLVLLERSDYYFLFSTGNVEIRDIHKGFEQLIRDNFRYIIVDKKYYKPDLWLKVKILLEEFMGKPKVYPEGLEVFQIK